MRSSLKQIGEAVGDPDDELAIKDEELDETPTLTDEELATGWLDNDLLPSGWKLKIACDGKPSGEEVRFPYNFFFSLEILRKHYGFRQQGKCLGIAEKDFHGAVRFDHGGRPSGGN